MGADFLCLIDHRLHKIRCSNQSFGGVLAIIVGDLYQLLPVFDKNGFRSSIRKDLPESDVNLWKPFKLFELASVMSQNEDLAFASLLNRLRTNDLTAQDEILLSSRVKPDTVLYPSLLRPLPHQRQC